MPSPSSGSMVRKVLAILFYVAAGFGVYLTIVFSVMPAARWDRKFEVTGLAGVAVIALLLIAVFVNRHWRWQRTVAITLLSGSSLALLASLPLVMLASSPALRARLKDDPMPMIARLDFVSGGTAMGTILLAAILLFWRTPARAAAAMR